MSSPEAPRRVAEPMVRKVSLPQAQEMKRRSRRRRRRTPPTTICQSVISQEGRTYAQEKFAGLFWIDRIYH